MRIINLASGSKGNCTLIEGDQTAFLIDCGLDITRTEETIYSVGCDISKIKAILITHTHIDHIKSAVKFANKYSIMVYATDKCWQEGKLQKVPLERRGFITLDEFQLNEFRVSPFELSHDAVSCVGYSVYNGGKKFSIATDLGEITSQIIDHIAKSDLIFLEANYDEHMLRTGSYPKHIKERILSRVGHLSNVDSGEAISILSKMGTKYFVLMHISENNNTPELAYGTVKNILKNKNLDNNIYIGVAYQHKVSSNFVLKPIDKAEGN